MALDDASLYAKQQAVKNEFDAMAVEKAQLDTKVDETVIEMNRLQGEWRMIQKIREELAAGTTPVHKEEEPDPAATIVAEPEVKRGRK